MMWIGIAVAAVLAAIVGFALWVRERRAKTALQERFKPIIDVDAERARIEAEIHAARSAWQREQDEARQQRDADDAARAAMRADLERDMANKRARWTQDYEAALAELARLTNEVGALTEEAELQSFGYYTPRFDFRTSDEYKARLAEITAEQTAMVKAKTAAVCDTEWTVEGSRAKGRQLAERNMKLILRAFNGEADAFIAKVNYRNATSLVDKLTRAFEAINTLAAPLQCRIVEPYLKLRLAELELTHELAVKLQDEKEEQRRIREQMREEEQAMRELERAQREAETQEATFEKALAKAKADLDQAAAGNAEKLQAKIAELEQKLAAAHATKEKALSMAQQTKAGHVYIISNIGSFGPDVFKVGMTRRLVPQDRVDELGDASVPFRFDVHAMVFSENAPELENRLHKALAAHQVNLMNPRREFFRVEPDELRRIVEETHERVAFTLLAEADEYRQSEARRAQLLKEAAAVSLPPAVVVDERARFADLQQKLAATAP